MTKRNSKCPCGSGKKYKKCCLNKDSENKSIPSKVSEIKKAYITAYANVYSYAVAREDFKDIVEDASKLFFPKKMECPLELQHLFNAFLIKDYLNKETKTNLILDYYKTFSTKISKFEAHILYKISISNLSIYEVESMNNMFATFRDIFTNEMVDVHDESLYKVLKKDKKYIACIVPIINQNILTDLFFEIKSENILENILVDIESLYSICKDDCDSFSDFLRRHCLLLYYHILQMECPETIKYFDELILQDKSLEIEIESLSIDKISGLSKEALENVGEVYKKDILAMISRVAELHNVSKISEMGWVSAAEYHIRKESGENITQLEIAKKYNISTSTLGKRYKILKNVNN